MRTRIVLVLTLLLPLSAAAAPELRVCADPNNLPFSNQQRQGFENRIIELIARDLHMRVEYVWWAQRRGNVRHTLQAGLCDVIAGVATSLNMLGTTQPYYHSSYVFVTRADRGLEIDSFDDRRLKHLIIGVQMIGDDSSNTPPAHELARRGMVQNVRGYMVYGDYAQESPARAIVDDVARGVLDIAVVWGPLAGYFSKRQAMELRVHPVSQNGLALPMRFEISMGVRKEDQELRRELDVALDRQRSHIAEILRDYGVPRSGP